MEPTLIQTLLKELRCRSCRCSTEIPPIQCLQGHHFCRECIKGFNNCPECRTAIATRSNYLFEKLMFNTTLQCSFTVAGCNVIGTATVIAEHEKCCTFHPQSGFTVNVTSNESEERTQEMNRYRELAQKSESEGQSLEKILHTELECPVCKRCIRPPIRQCEIGHVICRKCFRRVDQCIRDIRSPKSFFKNVALERLFQMMEMPCDNAENGCVFRGKGSLIPEHEKSCEHVLRFCPLIEDVSCTWQGFESEILCHCRTVHSDLFHSGPAQEWDLEEFLRDRHCNSSVKLIYANGILFMSCWYKLGDEVIFHVHFSGNEQFMHEYAFSMSVTPHECAKSEKIRTEIDEAVIYDENSIRLPLELLLKIRENGCSLIYDLNIIIDFE